MKPMNRTTFAVATAVLLLLLSLAGCGHRQQVTFPAGTTMDSIQKAGTITVGVKFDQYGIGFRNLATSKLEGFDIRIAETVAAGLGLEPRQIHYVEAVSGKREQLLQQHQVDIVIASYSITGKRQMQVGQAGPYFLTHQRLLVRAGDKHKITAPNDPPQITVCSVTGSTSLETVRKKYTAPPVWTVHYPTYTDCVQRLLYNSVDAVTTDDAILSLYEAQQPDKLAVVGTSISDEYWGIGYPKGDRKFCEYLTGTIKNAEDNGTWDKAFDDTLGRAGVTAPEKPPLNPCQD
jgi:glutamate transport system substrate-binding protein